MIRFCSLLLILMLAFGLDGMAANKSELVSSKDLTLIETFLEAAQFARGDKNSVWPGYDVLEQPVLFYRDRPPAILIGAESPPKQFKPYPVARFPEAKVFVSPNALDGIESQFLSKYDLGPLSVFVYRSDMANSPAQAAALVIHERFHVYQGIIPVEAYPGRFRKYSKDIPQIRVEHITPQHLAWIYLEQWCLAEALLRLEGPRDKWLDPLNDFIAVRKHRWEVHGSSWAIYENDMERNEGVAEYVTIAAMEKVVSAPLDHASLRIHCAMRLLDQWQPERMAWELKQGRFYVTGVAIAKVLEISIRRWEKKVQNGTALFHMLAKRFPLSRKERRLRLEAVRKRYRVDRMISHFKTVESSRKKISETALSEFRNWSGPRLVVDAPYIYPKTDIYYTAGQIYDYHEDGVLYIEPSVFEFNNAVVRLVIRGVTVLVERNDTHRHEILLPDKVSVKSSGKLVVPGPTPKTYSQISVHSRKVEVTAPKARMHRVGRTLHIVVSE